MSFANLVKHTPTDGPLRICRKDDKILFGDDCDK